MRHLLTALCLAGLLVVTAGLVSCSSDEQADNPDIGKDCTLDEDCSAGLICEADNTCQECQSCQVRDDCAEGYTCDQTSNCCKLVGCNADVDCADPKYCLELVCREKTCADDTECTRERHYCNDGVCISKECAAHEDCDSNLCDLDTYTCLSCAIDADCPDPINQICSQSACVDRNPADGDDVIGEKKGCEEFKVGCLYTRLACFDKIYPFVDYSSCKQVRDADGVEGFEFTFPDGAVWRSMGLPALYYQARGNSGFCYNIIPDPMHNELDYYDAGQTPLGSYSVNVTDDLVTVTCADGEKEYYRYSTLSTGECPGFQRSGIYTASVEGCAPLPEDGDIDGDLDEETDTELESEQVEQ
jgi:hypothetical protein